jgi:hypothetical protein
MGSSIDSISTVVQTPIQSSSPIQTSPPAPAATDVPKGQLNRTRDKLPTGWSNDGGHNGFKAADISNSPEGFYLAAVRAADVPRGRQ